MRRAMPALKPVLEILRGKHRYEKKASNPPETTGKPFSFWYEAALRGEIQIPKRLPRGLEDLGQGQRRGKEDEE